MRSSLHSPALRGLPLLLFLICTVLVFSQSIETTVEPRELTVGDEIRFTIAVLHSRDTIVEWPTQPELFLPFRLKEVARPLDRVREEENLRESSTYLLTIFQTGEQAIPSIPIQLRTEDGFVIDLSTQPEIVLVASVLSDDDPDLADIKQPAELTAGYLWVFILFGLLLVMAILMVASYNLYQRFHKVEEEPIQLPAHVIALQELTRLKRARLHKRGEYKRFYILLTRILKRYLNLRFAVYTIERTTAEILADIKRRGFKERLTRRIQAVLEEADLVKFAKAVPAQGQMTSDLKDVYQIVRESREPEEEMNDSV